MHREADPCLCECCQKEITYIQSPRCPRCGAGLGPYSSNPERGCTYCSTLRLYFDGAVSAVHFHGPVKELIHRFKYRKKEYLVRPLISIMTSALSNGNPFPENPHCIIPVPLHWRKKIQRGFNQAELLAYQIGRYMEVEVLPNNLARVRDTHPQTSLNHTQREENVKGAFRARIPARLQGKTILLVDDVLTTGLTASECARVLKRAGVERVYVLTVARSLGLDPGP